MGQQRSRGASRSTAPAAASEKILKTELGPRVDTSWGWAERRDYRSLFVTSRSRCPARSHAGSTARVHWGGQPGNGTVRQCRAWKGLTSSVSGLHGNTKLDLHVQTQVLTGVFGSRWFPLTFVRIKSRAVRGTRCLRQSSSGWALVRRADQLRKYSARVT